MIDEAVEIGMPVLNGARYLDRALISLLGQSHQNLRIILSDNGSSDDSLDIAQYYATLDHRVSVFSGAKGSAAKNFEFTLNQSSAKFFMWAAHDDLWDSDFLAQGLRDLQSGANYFSPNWWVGDISAGRGFSSQLHPLYFLDDTSALIRLLRFVNLHNHSQKCNIVYSLFDARLLKIAVARQSIANDGALGAEIVSSMRGAVSDKVFFYKQGVSLNEGSFRLKTAKARERLSSTKRRVNRGPDSFVAAKALGADELNKLFPYLPKTLDLIFSAYTPFATTGSQEIFPDWEHLLDLARLEMNASQFGGSSDRQ